MNKNDSTYIRQLTFWLRFLILAASIMTVAEDTLSFFTDKPIALFIDDTLWTKPISSFAIQDRLVLFGILNVKTMMWLIALYQIWKLCQLYRHTIFFTVQNARCFANIGRALVGMAVLDTLIVPLCGVFMKSQGIIAKMPDINIFMPEIDLLAAGIFFGLVSKIMERAAVMREEADFTI
ncbi:DUF2975 domain-containing protein [Desulfobacter vibrioformis]|uniref:DUF2975 domain-containing protein n=1 Tax=Desulfobacter vibrioformis TaxID=34031 RepID=UPI000551DF12|nr:DUF2975 domain-containing protein [Desulfobacter vibrioformis]